MADQVFVTNPMNIQLPPTPENPAGSVLSLHPGLNDIPEAAASDPFIVQLVKNSAPQVAAALADMETLKAVAEAEAARLLAVAEAQAKELEERTAAGEEWASKKQAAMDAGVPFNEAHPDPVTQQGMVMTGPPHVFAAPVIVASPQPGVGATPRVIPDLSGDTTGTTTGAGPTGGTTASTGTTSSGATGATGP